tara:strand:- start:406 stop:783 length:378 start_codon:yes stop_codon:yes gene_type:complete
MTNDLVTLLSPRTDFEANLLAIVLRDHGIEAFVFSSSALGIGVGFSAGSVGVPLQVRREDVDKAREILLANKRHSIDIDWHELESDGEGDSYVARPMPLTARIAFFCVVMSLLAGALAILLQFMN